MFAKNYNLPYNAKFTICDNSFSFTSCSTVFRIIDLFYCFLNVHCRQVVKGAVWYALAIKPIKKDMTNNCVLFALMGPVF